MHETTCPRCGGPDFEIIAEEVNIGVGVQTFVRGGECRTCGPLARCPQCGSWEETHATWCSALAENLSAKPDLTSSETKPSLGLGTGGAERGREETAPEVPQPPPSEAPQEELQERLVCDPPAAAATDEPPTPPTLAASATCLHPTPLHWRNHA